MSTRCLVLDMGFQPHRIVSWQRAVTMLFREVAEVVEEYDEEIRSVTFSMKLPAVIRLLRKVGRKRAVKFSRINVLTRDNFTCQYCGQRKSVRKLNYDHVMPRCRGGKTTWENIVTSCIPCNDKKRDRTPEQARMRLLKQPVKPKSLPIVAIHLDLTDIPSAWASYLYWNSTLVEG
jgi:5-methylcytosine-specific restriction endonuclease McrA